MSTSNTRISVFTFLNHASKSLCNTNGRLKVVPVCDIKYSSKQYGFLRPARNSYVFVENLVHMSLAHSLGQGNRPICMLVLVLVIGRQ